MRVPNWLQSSVKIHTLLVVFLLCFFVGGALYADDYGIISDVQLVRVYDGDTIFVNIPDLHPILGEEIGVRLLDIDTPELRGSCPAEKRQAVRARDLVSDILSTADRIELRSIDRGKYFRILAQVWVDNQNLSDLLLQEGLARTYSGGTKIDWCSLPTEPAQTAHPATDFDCGLKKACAEMVSCEEAQFYLTTCGISRLDGNDDGIPCESICK